MKKVFISLLLITFAVTVFSQQVVRERVIMEIATGTWCQFCPGAAMGADDMVANGHDVAVIEYHNGDVFANTASNYRNNYYAVPGYPTTHVDGVLELVGGSATQSLYTSYLNLYNQRIGVPCDYTATIYGENTSGLNYQVIVTIDLESGTPPSNATAHLVLTESEIQYSWQNQSELNFVCRAMYPDHLGTAVDFAGGDQMIITYNFTVDASWDMQHVELISFMQDEGSKEVLQGTMVPIEDLVPFQATANFSCSNTQPCDGTNVDFFDESMGQVISWNWYFEGGTPATSTDENPVVTYSSPGIYDVQLIVSDGSVIDTMLMTNYIDAISAPPAAGIPTGPSELCDGNTGYNYNTTGASWALDYTWDIDPASAGTIMGTSTLATLNLNPTYTGNIDITVRGNNQCGDGTWSDAFQVTVYPHPTAFWISAGSSYCEGTPGVEVTLDGSETGVSYELYLDGNATGTIVTGTGSPISFGEQAGPGIYTIHAYSDYCDINMSGTAYIYQVDVPGQAATPYGNAAACVGGSNDYSTNGAPDAETYIWTITPPEAGVITGSTVDATVVWDAAFLGAASISVQGINDCGDGIVSDPFDVTVEENPAPVISGDEYVYQNTEHAYSSPDHTSATYDWTVTGGTVTSGQGTNEVTIMWGNPGTGYVNLTETSAAECEGIAVELIVNVNPVGIEESFMNQVSIYPNPAGETLNMALYSARNANINVQVVNQGGQVILSQTESLSTGNNKTSMNTSELPNGIYTLKLIAEDGTLVQQKFIIMK